MLLELLRMRSPHHRTQLERSIQPLERELNQTPTRESSLEANPVRPQVIEFCQTHDSRNGKRERQHQLGQLIAQRQQLDRLDELLRAVEHWSQTTTDKWQRARLPHSFLQKNEIEAHSTPIQIEPPRRPARLSEHQHAWLILEADGKSWTIYAIPRTSLYPTWSEAFRRRDSRTSVVPE